MNGITQTKTIGGYSIDSIANCSQIKPSEEACKIALIHIFYHIAL